MSQNTVFKRWQGPPHANTVKQFEQTGFNSIYFRRLQNKTKQNKTKTLLNETRVLKQQRKMIHLFLRPNKLNNQSVCCHTEQTEQTLKKHLSGSCAAVLTCGGPRHLSGCFILL